MSGEIGEIKEIGVSGKVSKLEQKAKEKPTSYLAAQELRADLGLVGRVAERFQSIQSQQLEWLIDDHQESFRQLASMKPPFLVWLDHMNRRSEHVSKGMSDYAEMWREGVNSASINHQRFSGSAPAEASSDTSSGTSPGTSPDRGNLLERLHADHGRLAKVLKRMESLVNEPASPEQLDLLASAIDYVAEYPDAVHHPREDQLFTRLEAKDIDELDRQRLRKMGDAHKELARLTKEVAAALSEALESDDFDMGSLRKAIKSYAEAQREHMRFEESSIFPLAERYFDENDWGDAQPMPFDPVFDERVSRFEALYQSVDGGV